MSDDQKRERSQADIDLEREIRNERKFTLAEAIGRMAGPGAMKGESPATRMQQAEVEIQEYLCQHLPDAGSVLSRVLHRQVRDGEGLLKSLDEPLHALASHVEFVLGNDFALQEVVRQADVEWGRLYEERPYFESEEEPPDPDDPYTLESVRIALTQLLAKLTTGE